MDLKGLTATARKKIALLRACRIVGGRSALAHKIGAGVSQIGNWINRGDTIPYHYALLITQATEGGITLNQLCPEMSHINQLVMQGNAAIEKIPLATIRYEKDTLHEQTVLPASTNKNTTTLLAQPILVDSNYRLLAFTARLQAHRHAKSATVPAIVVDINHHLQTQVPIDSVLRLCPPSERVVVGEIIKQQLGKRQGRPVKAKKFQKNTVNFKGRSLDLIAQLVGLGNRVTYSQAKQVLITGCHQLIQAMDNKTLAVSLAVKLTVLPLSQQQALLLRDKKTIRTRLKEIVSQKRNKLSPSAQPLIAQKGQVDIVALHDWLLQQGVPAKLHHERGNYMLTLYQREEEKAGAI